MGEEGRVANQPVASTLSSGDLDGDGRFTYDELLVSITHDVPGFAGLWLDESGSVTVALTSMAKTGDETAVLDSWERITRVRLDHQTGLTNVASARYDFAQLYVWKQAVEALTGIPGISIIDADEANNTVFIGVERVADVARVYEVAKQLGIPEDAISVEPEVVLSDERSELTEASGQNSNAFGNGIFLNDYFRPLEGGFEIAVSSNGTCTLGFHVVRNGVLGFITNAHCTASFGGVDGNVFYQGSWGNTGERIAHETVDPLFTVYGAGLLLGVGATTFGPPAEENPYRYSDAAYALYEGTSVNASFGQIARTYSRSHQSAGSLKRDNAFIITSNATFSQAPMGLELNKVGKKTGWTYGNITRTCFEATNTEYPTYRLKCQFETDMFSDSGDSGSPVFQILSGNDVRLHGIHWGGYTHSSGEHRAVFSNFQSINNEIGPGLITH